MARFHGTKPGMQRKALHGPLFPALDSWGGVVWPRNRDKANQDRIVRELKSSKRIPWRRPKPVYTEGDI